MTPHQIAVASIPFDQNSSYRQGTALGPARIREALYCDSANLWTETGHDLGNSDHWRLLPPLDSPGDLADIEEYISTICREQTRVVSLGGDHSITLPIIRALVKQYPDLSILHLDAHPDLYDKLDANRFSHACPFARIMEEFPDIRLVQAGIRTANGHQREQAARFGVEMLEMKDGREVQEIVFTGPVYLSLDLDCLDPAFAPGVSHHEPGGMSTREVISIIQNLTGTLVGADIVEYNPERDLNAMTAMVAAKLLKEILGRMTGEAA